MSEIRVYSINSDPTSLRNSIAGIGWERVICPASFMGLHGVPEARWLINEDPSELNTDEEPLKNIGAVGIYMNYRIFPFGSRKKIQEIYETASSQFPDEIILVGDAQNIFAPFGFELQGEPSLHHKMILKKKYRKIPEISSASNLEVKMLTESNVPQIDELIENDRLFQISRKYGDRISRSLPYFGVFENGILIAIAGCYGLTPEFELANIGDVYTHPDFRRRGYATTLINEMVGYLIGQGAEMIGCDVSKDGFPVSENGKPVIYNVLKKNIGFDYEGDIYYQNAKKLKT